MKQKVRTRSTSVISKETVMIDSFSDPVSEKTYEVRRLVERNVRQHFIVTIADYDTAAVRVRPVTEVNILNHKPRILFDISTQYPDLKERAGFLTREILSTVCEFYSNPREKEDAGYFSKILQ
ncbi:TPA: hypothetical protein ACPJ0R_000931 [Vibrio diabolicus]|uniref:hypothetical protein n=1 Tax=Vibrio harveyi group TaxID=717610 RepID=UPI00215E45CB|nr:MULTISPECIES: hypothetical protein [Vibrio harveyi group]MCS0454545.1 hypothetical protein [Vibrio diabolicus]HCE4711369.1 hypothetical protein [Vibrio parahaemolyticus]HCG9793021.1 hypothetical protein [Vibrio parahaemolyticus]